MIDHICKSTLEKLSSNNIIKEEEAEVYGYGLELLIVTILKIIGFIIIAFTLDLVKETLIFTIYFSGLRIQAGGYHARTPFKCFVSTIIIMFPGILLVRLIPIEKQLYYILISTTISIFLIYKYAPVESKNKPLTREEDRIYRRRSLMTVIVGSIIIFLLICLSKSFTYLGSIGLTGFLIESVTLIPISRENSNKYKV